MSGGDHLKRHKRILVSKVAGRALHRLMAGGLIRYLLGLCLPARYVVRPVNPATDVDSLGRFGTTLRPFASRAQRDGFRREFETTDPGGSRFLVAARAGSGAPQIRGFIRARVRGGVPVSTWWIEGLEVRPQYWGRGVGRALCRSLVSALHGEGAREIRLSVGRDNIAACALYRSLGFAEDASNDSATPSVVMVLRIP